MGLFSEILLLPLAPVRGVIKLAEVIQERVDQELNDPATTRRQLEELEEKRERGEISAEEEQHAQQKVLEARITPKPPKPVDDEEPPGAPRPARDDVTRRPAGRGESRKTVRRREPGGTVAAARRRGTAGGRPAKGENGEPERVKDRPPGDSPFIGRGFPIRSSPSPRAGATTARSFLGLPS